MRGKERAYQCVKFWRAECLEYVQSVRCNAIVPMRGVDGTVGLIGVLLAYTCYYELMKGETTYRLASIRFVFNFVFIAYSIHNCTGSEQRISGFIPTVTRLKSQQSQQSHSTTFIALIVTDFKRG